MPVDSVASFSILALFESAGLTKATAFYLLSGVGVTLLLVVLAMSLGLVFGSILAAFQVYGPPWTGRLVSIYVWFFRGVPILVLMFLFHFGLSGHLETAVLFLFDYRLRVPPFASAVMVLAFCTTAYQSQIFRGGIEAIAAGQFKAAQALGMGRAQAVWTIILPQTWRISIPAWSNEYSILLKDSAIAFVLGVMDVMARVKAVSSTNHRPLLMFIIAGIIYYLLTWVGVKLLLKLYHKIRIPGLAEADGSHF